MQWQNQSLLKNFGSSYECHFRNNTYSLYKLMLSSLWEWDKRFATAIKPSYQKLFWGEEKIQTSPSCLCFELPIRVSVSPKTLPIALSVARIMCVLLYFCFGCSSIPNSLNIIFPSPNLPWYIWFCHIFIANKWKFSSHFLLNFFFVKQNLDAQFLFTFSSLQVLILHYHYLFPYRLYCFLQLFK